MADDAAAGSSEEPQVTFHVKSSSDAKYELTIPASTTVADVKTKLSGADYADLPVDRQRLIYSGRVLKDHDTLASVKIKDGHTVHLVKGAASNARQNPANQGSSTGSQPAVPQVPTNLATGTGHDPLAGLTGARYAGFHGLPGMDAFGPDGGMGPPPNTDHMLRMMDDPNFLQQMNEAMDNPMFQQMMTNHPALRDNPMVQAAMQNPELRRMMFNPQMLRMQLQMQQQMQGQGGGGDAAFPAPGVTNTTPQTGDNAPTQPPPNPFAMMGGGTGGGVGGGAGGQANPFAALFGPGATNPFAPSNTTPTTSPPPTASAGQGTPANPTPSTQPPNPFANLFGAGAQQPGGQDPLAQMTQQLMQNPEAMRSAMQMFGGMGGAGSPPTGGNAGAANPFGNLFGPGGMGAAMPGMGAAPPAPVDSRPPEEVYEAQLRQLNDMGFYEFERNVQALRRSGGSVQGAIEHLLSG